MLYCHYDPDPAFSPLVGVYAYLEISSGDPTVSIVPLSSADENRLGRAPDSAVVLTDPLCSRLHAIIREDEGHWQIVDHDSRNGTFVNDQKIDEATLAPGSVIRIGSVRFIFRLSKQPIPSEREESTEVTQTVIMDTPMDSADPSGQALAQPQRVAELHSLFQLSMRLLDSDEPDDVVRQALDLLTGGTRAAVVGYLWIDDSGELKPQLVLPENSDRPPTLSTTLTEMVTKQGRAVWVANQTSDQPSGSLRHFADAVCAPLVHSGRTLGAIHVYLRRGRFRQSDFDFVIAVANVLAIALARARQTSILKTDLARLADANPGFSELIGESPEMLDLKDKIGRVGPTASCVLVRGPSGVGKELVARAIHRVSPRSDRPLVAVNCAALPADLMESQLFGHRAGAFTGADRDHSGFFRQADMGTLFLDEVGELSLEGQAKLLRVLEGHPFCPVGASEEVQVDVRVIAATNQDLETLVGEQQFREDLFYRLNVVELMVPALARRGTDLGLLVDFFLEKFQAQHGRPQLRLSSAAREKLLGYHWPGNVRQLRNVIDSTVVMARGDEITPHETASGELASLRIEDWEQKLIVEALRRTDNNVLEAARLLGIGRATLYRKIEQYEIQR